VAFISDTHHARDALLSLVTEGATSLPLLASEALPSLLAAAQILSYRVGRREIGSGKQVVRQDFDICMAPPKPNLLWDLATELEEHLAQALDGLRPPLLSGRFGFNDLVVQRYHPDSFGITMHRDHVRYTGLVALIQLSGDGQFFVSNTRSGSGEREICSRPGDLLLMRAPGFAGRKDRPFHYLSNIVTERYNIGLRHDTKPG